MTTPPPPPETAHRRERLMLDMIAVCCAGPMLLIVVLTSVLGVAIGPAAAIAIGVMAGGLCVTLMLARHRRPHPEAATDEH